MSKYKWYIIGAVVFYFLYRRGALAAPPPELPTNAEWYAAHGGVDKYVTNGGATLPPPPKNQVRGQPTGQPTGGPLLGGFLSGLGFK